MIGCPRTFCRLQQHVMVCPDWPRVCQVVRAKPCDGARTVVHSNRRVHWTGLVMPTDKWFYSTFAHG